MADGRQMMELSQSSKRSSQGDCHTGLGRTAGRAGAGAGADPTHATAASTRRRCVRLCYAWTMATRSPFPPIVCIVDFHHARFALSPRLHPPHLPLPSPAPVSRSPCPHSSLTCLPTAVLRLRPGSVSTMAPIPRPTTTGRCCPSWPCPTALTRGCPLPLVLVPV